MPVANPHMEDVDRCRESPGEEERVFNVLLCVNCFKCQTQTLGLGDDAQRARGMQDRAGQGRDDGDTSTAVHRVRSPS